MIRFAGLLLILWGVFAAVLGEGFDVVALLVLTGWVIRRATRPGLRRRSSS